MTQSGGTLGRYEDLRVIGRGGFATVYVAHDPQLDRSVALKTLMAHLAEDPGVVRRFLAEARTIARLNHPNIVTIYEAGEADGRPYYAMEYVAGKTLADELASAGALSLERALTLLRPLAAALDHLHRANLIHRDVKPANVMLSEDGRVLLMDFGIARAVAPDVSRLTQSGTSLGTPTYMSPEQVLGVPAGPAADIYSLAVIAFQMIAGRPPFSGATAQVLHAQAYEPPPSLRELRPGLPEHVYAAIDAALAKTPGARPAAASLFIAQLSGEAPIALAAEVEEIEPTEINTIVRAAQPLAAEVEPTILEEPEPRFVPVRSVTPPPTPSPEAAEQPEAVAAPIATEPEPAQDPEAAAAVSSPAEAERDAEPSPAAAAAAAPPPQPPPPVSPPAPERVPAPAPSRRRGRFSRPVLIGAGVAAVVVVAAVAGGVVLATRSGGNKGGTTATGTTDGGGAGSNAAAPPAAAPGTVQLVATDNHYSTNRITGTAGQPITLSFSNKGQHQHNIHLLNLRDRNGNDWASQVIPPGGSTSITFTVNGRGTWAFRCDIFPQEMNGTIVIE